MSDENLQSFDDDSQALSMQQIVWHQFIEHKMAVVGMAIITIFVMIALSAPMISKITGIDPEKQNIFKRYQKPFSTIEYSQDDKEAAIEKFIEEDAERSQRIIAAARSANVLESEVTDEDFLFEIILSEDKSAQNRLWELKSQDISELESLCSRFTSFHLLGTDELGRDVLMRLVFGTRVSIAFGIMVALASAFLGLLIGSLAGYYGGWIDSLLSRFIDALLSLPSIPLMIIFAAVDISKIPFVGGMLEGENQSVLKLSIVIALFSWMTVARLVRGSILSIKEREFILAAKTLGARDVSIILSHIVPNVISPLLVAVTLNVGNSILSEAALSFLGLGIQPPTPSWGNMLFNAQELIFEAPLLAILPGLLILLTVISFNFVGDGLQNAIDPKSIRR
ncbi:MAG: ABC transporter permease [Bdellovibrionota bacterium]